MDFQFKTDITGQPIARCEFECEAFGDWLTNDISNNHQQVSTLLINMEQIRNKQSHAFEMTTQEYYLEIHNNEVSLSLINTTFSHQDNIEEFTDYEDNEQTTGCGLEDFYALIKAWHRFISS